MQFFKISLPFIILLVLATNSIAQNTKAVELMNNGDFSGAVHILTVDKSLEDMETDNLTALGICYINLKNYVDAETVYRELTSRKKTNPANFMYYGEILLINKKYDKAKNAFQRFLEDHPDNPRANLKVQSCDSLKKWAHIETDVNLTSVNVNSEEEEKSSFLYQDKLVFVTNRIPESYWDNESLEENSAMGYLIANGEGHLFQENLLKNHTCEAADYCPATNTLAFTLRKKKTYMYETGFSKAGIYFKKPDDLVDSLKAFEWDNMPEEINLAHPAFAENGKRLFFISDMPGGYGSNDLYYSDYKNGKWSEPMNAGENINTAGNEVFPVVSGDSMLYYASDGFPGYGNLDVFSASIDGNKFGKPVNMKKPINSLGNDFSYYPENPFEGYMTSNRSNLSKGKHDVFRHSRPRPAPEPEKEPEVKPLVFHPETFTPTPVYFEISHSSIDPVFISSLQQIADTMKRYKDISIQLTGHAGSKGPKSTNKKLALQRAETVKSQLVTMGIEPQRISLKNAGITDDRTAPGITFYVQIGTSPNNDAAMWYEQKFDHSVNIKQYQQDDYTIYFTGAFDDKQEAWALANKLEETYGVNTLVNYGSKGKLLGNSYHTVNRRVEFSWIK